MSQPIIEDVTTGDDVAAYRYELPERLIAQQPAAARDASRLLVLGEDGTDHRRFNELPDLLNEGDVLVLNDSRVFAARLRGKRIPGCGAAELLLLHPAASPRYDESATRWLALARPGRKLRRGARIAFEALGEAEIVDVRDDGIREVQFVLDAPFSTLLAQAGRLALPPYIHNESEDAQHRYQTVFAQSPGSVAAPTASLHFTNELLRAIQDKGARIAFLTLDIGLGTFSPIKANRLDQHAMHAETFTIPQATIDAIERARRESRRVIAGGTTVLRALEASIHKHGRLAAGADETDLFIRPGFDFRAVDALITNFHLPQSTLLVLVCAFAGRERILSAYREAIDRGYRFYSFGDAMLVQTRSAA